MEKKVIIIAGATSMIGRACIKTLDQAANILILLGKSNEKLNSLSRQIKCESKFYVTDFTSESQIQASIEAVRQSYKRIDAIVYNVAIYPLNKIENISIKEWQLTYETNLTGAFLLSKLSIPNFKKQKFGKIVYISSLAGPTIGVPYMSSYSTTKAGLIGLMRTCAIELAPFNINVNAVSPGRIYDINNLSANELSEKLRPMPFARFIEPEDIAHMVDFLISNKAKNITGQNMIIDGGQSIVGDTAHIKNHIC